MGSGEWNFPRGAHLPRTQEVLGVTFISAPNSSCLGIPLGLS